MKSLIYILLIGVVLSFFPSNTLGQVSVGHEAESKENVSSKRERGLEMLRQVESTLEDHYYDKNFRGIDLVERFKLAAEKIKSLESNSEIFRVIAQVVLDLNDSHTTFFPPARANRVDYGFTMKMIGIKCFVTDVKKGSDAEKQGIKPGDIVKTIGQYEVSRDNFWLLNYYLNALDPQLRLNMAVVNEKGDTREVIVESAIKALGVRMLVLSPDNYYKGPAQYKCEILGSDAIACHLNTFLVDEEIVDKMMKEAAKFKKLILDLRGNGGGLVSTEEYLAGHFFDREVQIAKIVTRKKSEDLTAKPVKENAFKGDLIVLIDSESASASEIFSRLIQIEKRGKVVGDVSAGAVMTSNQFRFVSQRGWNTSSYGLSVTIADVIMSDGNRLENVGVIPDHLVGPTREAIFEKNDPVLSYAASLFGATISPADAGKFYFINKKPEEGKDEDATDKDK